MIVIGRSCVSAINRSQLTALRLLDESERFLGVNNLDVDSRLVHLTAALIDPSRPN